MRGPRPTSSWVVFALGEWRCSRQHAVPLAHEKASARSSTRSVLPGDGAAMVPRPPPLRARHGLAVESTKLVFGGVG